MNVIEHIEQIEYNNTVECLEISDKKDKYCIIVSGLVRGFFEHLFEFLKELPEDLFDIYLHFSNNDSKFMNSKTIFEKIKVLPKNFKQFDDELSKHSSLPFLSDSKYSNREINTFFQYYRLKSIIPFIENFHSYKQIIRIRPDISFKTNISQFIKLLQTIDKLSQTNIIHIPKGYDIFDSKILFENSISIDKCINDQIAICKPHIFEIYANTYNLLSTSGLPIISEYILYNNLVSNKVEINRIEVKDLEYVLVLSECRTIAISGDSASGKSQLLKLLSEIFPYDKRILLETDRYHKYERHDSNWKYITHLDPNANNLEKMADDMYNLKLGDDIYSVDYDHKTGKFTEPELIHSKPFLLLCGLHTMYSDSIRNLSDLKIFMDTQTDLKIYWKIQRDVSQRGYKLETVLDTIKKRSSDFQTFVLPQKNFANIIIKYDSRINLSELFESSDFSYKLSNKDLKLTLIIDFDLYLILHSYINSISGSCMNPYISSISFDKKIISLSDDISNNILKDIAIIEFKNEIDISYDEILKTIFSIILYK